MNDGVMGWVHEQYVVTLLPEHVEGRRGSGRLNVR